jgi:4-carboxymuconolactone decarboxylase
VSDLTARQQATAAIAAFTATGRIPQLREALVGGLAAGLSVNQIKETLVQMYASSSAHTTRPSSPAAR